MTTEKLIGIRPDGSISELTISETKFNGNFNSILENLAKKVEIVEKIDKNLYIGAKSGKQKAAVIMKKFRIKTYFHLSDMGNDFITPAWVKHRESTFLDLSVDVPDSMILMIVQSQRNMYMIAVSKRDGNAYRLPLTNLFDEGRICMGHSYKKDEHGSVFERMDKAMETFDTALWNDHLIEKSKSGAIKAMFNWNMHDKKFVPFPENWEEYCTVISHDAYNEFCKKVAISEGYVPPKPKEEEAKPASKYEPDADGYFTWNP